MNYEPAEEEIQRETEASLEEGRRWLASATPEQLAAMDASSREHEINVLIAYARDMEPARFVEFARDGGVADDVLAEVYRRMAHPVPQSELPKDYTP